MKQSEFTEYLFDESIIYEYKNNYFIMELCQQGKELNPSHGSRQAPSDIAFLSCSLHKNCSPNELGSATLAALEIFDSRGHPYDKFDLPTRGKYISGLIGARGLPSLERGSRQILIKRDIKKGEILIYPTDNNNINPWIEIKTPLCVPSTTAPEEIGNLIIEAFSLSTFHPKFKI